MNKQEASLGQLKEPKSRSGFSWRDLKTFDSFSNPAYRFYYLTVSGQWASTSMQTVTQSLLIYRLTGSGVILGSLALAQAFPLFFFSFIGGVIADRVPKKYVIFCGHITIALMAFINGTALVTGYLSKENAGSWWLLMLASAVQGTYLGMTWPSAQGMIRDIVKPHQMMNAVSLGNMGNNAFQLLGPAAAGFLVDGFGFHAVYYLISAIYCCSAFASTFLPYIKPNLTSARHPFRDLIDGLYYVKGDRRVFLILLFALFTSLFGMPFTQMLPMFTEDVLKVGASGLGILAGTAGLGALVGSLVFASLPSKKGGTIFLLTGMGLGLGLMVFSLSSWWYLSLVTIIFVGLSRTGKVTLENSLTQRYSDPAYRGRALSLLAMQISFTSFGTFAVGVVAESIGVQLALGGLSAMLLIISIVMWKISPLLRNLD